VINMPEVLLLEFPGATLEQYRAVNAALGVDSQTGEGDWPAPLLSHTAAVSDDGLLVVEVWESQDAQKAFMDRLGPALGTVGVPEPSRVEWRSHLGSYHA
jgi:hypothetical protein